jgi:predicted  nucleic acid-binding Zn-ribbon protein
MTTATDTDFQQVKDLITAGNAVIQKQISDLALQISKLEGDLRETKTDLKGDIRELRSELKALDTKFDRPTDHW